VADLSSVYPDDDGRTNSEAILAASLVVIRDGDDGLEVLMLRRPPGGNFGGFWVFPGGKVDHDDRDPDDPNEMTAFRRAAAREAAEECALAIEHEGLVTVSYWEPPPRASVRFGTWFFVARHPETDVVIDGSEIVEYDWVRPRTGHARRDAGDFDLAPPTWITLETLAEYATVTDVLDGLAASAQPPEYRTRIVKHDGVMKALWTGDAGYDHHDAAVPGARHRLVMGPQFTFELHPES
jgi:8-oxo-dGTP pyrophosphatase MutT (NUDIX family)